MVQKLGARQRQVEITKRQMKETGKANHNDWIFDGKLRLPA